MGRINKPSSALDPVKAITFSVFLGFGLAGCAGSGDEAQEPVDSDINQVEGSEESFSGDTVLPEEEGEDYLTESSETNSEPSEDYAFDSFSEGDSTGEDAVVRQSDTPLDEQPDVIEDPFGETGGFAETTMPTVSDSEPMGASVWEESAFEAPSEPAASETLAAMTAPTDLVTPPGEVSSLPSAAGVGTYVVLPGDTLNKISTKIYGTARRWMELAQANHIPGPYLIHPGDRISYDTRGADTFTAAYQAIPRKTVVVQPGDTLSKIARRVLGGSWNWKVLHAFNKDIITNPNHIEVGMVLSYLDQEAVGPGNRRSEVQPTGQASGELANRN